MICQHCIKNITILLVVSDNGSVILNEKVVTELPDEWVYSRYLGDLIIEKNKISLIDKKKKVFKSFIV